MNQLKKFVQKEIAAAQKIYKAIAQAERADVRPDVDTDSKPLMDSAAHVIEKSYYTQRQPHLTIEPDMGCAYFDEEGRLTITDSLVVLAPAARRAPFFWAFTRELHVPHRRTRG